MDKSLGNDYVIDIVGLGKSFQRRTMQRGGYSTLKSLLLGFAKSRSAVSCTVPVLRDLTLRVRRGSSMGIIGKNGSGKSTLLKLITGIYKPTVGTVAVRGRVAALIELGAGFHPDFTGRENLYLGGVMHGLSRREIERRFDEIVDFAELKAVIDDPIRTYSSGMFMRLGFSLAVHTDPDLLLIDEVLAVGDAAFVAKCKERISKLRGEGKTFLLVSHDLDAVERWCDEAVWLNQGVVHDRGDPRRVIDHYRQYIESAEEQEIIEAQHRHDDEAAIVSTASESSPSPQRWGSREVEIVSTRLLNEQGEEHALFHTDEGMIIECHYRVHEEVNDLVFGIGIHRNDGLVMHGSNTDIERVSFIPRAPEGVLRYRVKRLGLLDGHFSIDVALHRGDGYPFDYHKGVRQFAVRARYPQVGVLEPEHEWLLG